jgi:hypothetical protein
MSKNMRTFIYENEIYWQCTEISAIRPHLKDRVKILNFEKDGTIACKSRTVKPWIRQMAEDEFRRRGIAYA